MRIAFLVSYIGTGFFGSQRQPGRRTVEGEFIDACLSLGLFEDPGSAGFGFSGRTDRGVHAMAQVCAFNTEHSERAVSALNRKLPGDIRCNGWAEVSEGYNPRFAVSSRTYRYFFPGTDLDMEKMEIAAIPLAGTHDFSRFARTEGRSPVRTIFSVGIIAERDGLIFEISGESFLWNMVRCIAYALILAGEGSAGTGIIEEALENTTGPRFPAAPPEGLVLWDVETDLEFSPMSDTEKSRAFTRDFGRKHCQLKKMSEFFSE